MGPVSDRGLDILDISIGFFKQLYPEFRVIVCYNQIPASRLDRLRKHGIELFDSTADALFRRPATGYHEHWKLFPPRIDVNSYEIVCDNDILITRRIDKIEQCVHKKYFLGYQALGRNYGNYDIAVPKCAIRINSGLYGFPPGYDPKSELESFMCLGREDDWVNRFDDQGLIGAVLLNDKPLLCISQLELPIVEPDELLDAHEYNPLCCGYHFVFSNRSGPHTGWDQYRKRNLI